MLQTEISCPSDSFITELRAHRPVGATRGAVSHVTVGCGPPGAGASVASAAGFRDVRLSPDGRSLRAFAADALPATPWRPWFWRRDRALRAAHALARSEGLVDGDAAFTFAAASGGAPMRSVFVSTDASGTVRALNRVAATSPAAPRAESAPAVRAFPLGGLGSAVLLVLVLLVLFAAGWRRGASARRGVDEQDLADLRAGEVRRF